MTLCRGHAALHAWYIGCSTHAWKSGTLLDAAAGLHGVEMLHQTPKFTKFYHVQFSHAGSRDGMLGKCHDLYEKC